MALGCSRWSQRDEAAATCGLTRRCQMSSAAAGRPAATPWPGRTPLPRHPGPVEPVKPVYVSKLASCLVSSSCCCYYRGVRLAGWLASWVGLLEQMPKGER